MDIRYIDTRGNIADPLSFSETVIAGLAPGGGLFVPCEIPSLALEQIIELGGRPYAERAAAIYKAFGVDFSDDELSRLMGMAYGDNFDTPQVAPVVKVGDEGMYVLELWHGPTSAFKDMALQCLPVFFSASVSRLQEAGELDHDFLIAVATSGDTGKAALEGFADRDHVSIVVFYPDGGVSDIQFKQMATQRGSNVCVYGVRGNFDDCQTSVKRMFGDEDFNAGLAADKRIALSSANSINWGRLLPQVCYYVSAYAQMVADGHVEAGDPIDVTVPTGNFGNILACWYAKQLGVPIGAIVCASNDNRVLTDFIESGTYTIKDRPFVLTPSPSMDILVSSNLERQLFELVGRDPAPIRKWMRQLNEEGSFTVDEKTFAAMRANYKAGSVNSDACLATIKEVFENEGYLLDPHTAVAWRVASDARSANPMLVASTARWAKFGGDVYRALAGIPAGKDLPEDVAALTGAELNRKVVQMTGVEGTYAVPAALDGLDAEELRFCEVIGAQRADVEAAVLSFLTE